MPPDEELSAVVRIRDQASDKLENIAEELESVRDSALAAAEATDSAAESFDEAKDEASGLDAALESLQETAGEATGALQATDSAAEAAGDSFEEAAADANSLDRALSGVNRSAAAATGSLGTVGAAEALSGAGGDVDLEDVSRSVEKTARVQSEGGDPIVETLNEIDGVTAESRVDVESDGLDEVDETLEKIDDTTVSPDVDPESADTATVQQSGFTRDVDDDGGLFGGRSGIFGGGDQGAGFDGISNTMDRVSRTLGRGLDLDLPDFEETRREAEGLANVFDRLPAMELGIESEEDFDEFAGGLQKVASAGDNASRSLKAIDDDELIETADSTRELRRALSRTDHGTVRTEKSLRSLEGASRDLFDSLVASSSGVDAFETQSEQLGDQAIWTSGQLNDLEGETRDIAVQASIAAERTDEFGDEVAEAGRQSTSAAAQVQALDTAMQDLGPNIGDVSTRVAGFRASLATLGRITPMVLSLTTALGGLATAAASAGGVLGGVFAGGLLAVGERMGNQLAAANAGMEDLEGTAKDAVEAQSQLGRTMAGVEEFMNRVKQAAYEAMQPLMTRQTAEFTIQGIEGALTMLHELAQLASDMSGFVMDVAMDIAGTWWQEWPDIAREIALLTEALLPIFADLVKGAIRALPEIFAAMRTEGQDLLPLLGDFLAVLIDILPTLTRLGTAMLTLLIPVLEGFALALEWLEPLTSALAETLIWLGETFGDQITTIAALVGMIYAMSSAIKTVGIVATGLKLILGGALGIVADFVAYILGAGIAKTVATWATRFGAVAKILEGIAWTIGGIIAGMGTLGAIITGGAILLGIGAIISYFDWWDEIIEGIIMKWNTLVGWLQLAARILQDITGMFDGLAKKVGTLEVAVGKADEWADKIPGQDSDGGGGGGGGGGDGWLPDVDLGGGGGGDSMRPTPDQPSSGSDRGTAASPGGRGGQYDSGTTVEEINIDSSPETNDAEIKRAAREAIKKANQEERRRNSSLN